MVIDIQKLCVPYSDDYVYKYPQMSMDILFLKQNAAKFKNRIY